LGEIGQMKKLANKILSLPFIFCFLMSPTVQAQSYSITPFEEGAEFKCTMIAYWAKGDEKYSDPIEAFKNFNLIFVGKMSEVIMEWESKIGMDAYSYKQFVNLKKDFLHLEKGDLGVNYTRTFGPAIFSLDVFENGKIAWVIADKNIAGGPHFNLGACPNLRLDIKVEL
jgi:hypothetical protein